jgi:hypothetical protein
MIMDLTDSCCRGKFSSCSIYFITSQKGFSGAERAQQEKNTHAESRFSVLSHNNNTVLTICHYDTLALAF